MKWKGHFFVDENLISWVWVNTYIDTIFSGLFTSINPSYDLGFTRYQGFDPSPDVKIFSREMTQVVP